MAVFAKLTPHQVGCFGCGSPYRNITCKTHCPQGCSHLICLHKFLGYIYIQLLSHGPSLQRKGRVSNDKGRLLAPVTLPDGAHERRRLQAHLLILANRL